MRIDRCPACNSKSVTRSRYYDSIYRGAIIVVAVAVGLLAFAAADSDSAPAAFMVSTLIGALVAALVLGVFLPVIVRCDDCNAEHVA